jgi:hypothetical protein
VSRGSEVHHVVLFRFRPDVPAAQVEELAVALRGLASDAEGVVSYACGPDLGLGDGNDDFAIVAAFMSPAALAGYLGHPAHAEIVRRFVPAMVAEKHSVQLGAAPASG